MTIREAPFEFTVYEEKLDENRRALPVGRLVKIRRVALRRRIWFRVLNRVERGIIDLTVSNFDNIRSTRLANLLVAIVKKLQLATESKADKLVRTVGISLAQKISKIAVGWGNQLAFYWSKDLAFARYLAFSTENHFRQEVMRFG